MIRRAFAAAAFCLLAAGPALGAEEERITYYLVDGFSVPPPSSGTIQCAAAKPEGRAGIAARLSYRIPGNGTARIEYPDNSRPVPRAGEMRLWVKGDGSGNQLQLRLRHSGRRELQLKPIALDFDAWREIILNVAAQRGNPKMWLWSITIGRPKGAKGKENGEILLDNIRLYPSAGKASSATIVRLKGSRIRPYSPDISFGLEISYFGADPTTATAHIRMTDHNENEVLDRTFDELKVPEGQSREALLELKPENLHLYLPPFKIKGEVFSPDMREVFIEETLVMGNSFFLFEDFSNVFGRWFTSGMVFPLHWDGWNTEWYGELQHACARTQTGVRISRVEIDRAKAANQQAPPGRFAMQIDYNGQVAVFNGIDRYLDGDAYRMGMWVRGDGSGAELRAIVLDFSAPGHTMYTWKRSFGMRTVCKLDFKGWRYFEVPLPGDGIGPRTPGGSTEGVIDFPLDLSALVIVPPRKGARSGSIMVGPIFLHTQQRSDESLSVQLGYDDPNHEYAPDRGAWVTVQNGWRPGGRSVDISWSLAGRDKKTVARGREKFDLDAMGQRTFAIDLATHKSKIARSPGPLRLRVLVRDARETASAEAEIILSKPDSVALISDFESDRGYLGLNAYGVNGAPPPGEQAARTTTDQKHSGKRSLALPWRKNVLRPVSVDPPMPGIPTSISLWVHGDGSNVLFYPLIGDRFGVVSGVDQAQWNLFLPRTKENAPQNAVTVNWKGWREVTFRLPVIPESWQDTDLVLPFVPNYPFGVHLAVMSQGNSPDNGVLYIDDIRVESHIEPAEQLAMVLERSGDTNLIVPGGTVRVIVSNLAAPGPRSGGARKAVVSGGLYNWRGERVAGTDKAVQLAPGKSQFVVIAQNVTVGAYALRVDLKEGDNTLRSMKEDLLVADLGPVLGPEWRTALRDTTKLRLPLKDRYAFIRHDWDWAEFQPGNLQAQTLLRCAAMVRAEQRDPYVLLGYSTYWAWGPGFEDMLSGRLSNREDRGPGGRDWGHEIDAFHVPERMDDWENYVMQMMRFAGRHVAGWILWNAADSRSSLAVPPADFARMITLADKWRRQYCPDTPLILGGMARGTALPYLWKLKQAMWEIKKDELWEAKKTELWKRHKQDFLKRKKADFLERREEELWASKKEKLGLTEEQIEKLGPDELNKKKAQVLKELKKDEQNELDKELKRIEQIDPAELTAKDLAKLKDKMVAELEPSVVDKLKEEAVDHFTGVNLRIDAGTISAEDGRLPEYMQQLQAALRVGNDGEKTVLLTDLDWAVEKAGLGLDAFDQAAFLIRAHLLLDRIGVHPSVILHNEDAARLGFGLIYKRELTIPPLVQKLPAFQFKPAWWAMVQAKDFLGKMKVVAEIDVQDVVSGRTRCLLYESRADRKPAAVVWRNNTDGFISFASTGMKVESAQDMVGAAVPAKDGWYTVGKLPIVFVLSATSEPPDQALARLRVRERAELLWPQDVITAFTHKTGKRHNYAQTGGKETVFLGKTVSGDRRSWPALEFAKGGTERFAVDVPGGAGLVLRKRYFLGEKFHTNKTGKKEETEDPHGSGQTAEVLVNGKPYGTWNLKRIEAGLSGGLREAIFVIGKEVVKGKKTATVELRYEGTANTAGWVVYAYREGDFPMSALGPLHADSTVTCPRMARNIVGLKMHIGKASYRNGIGVFAPCLMEYPLNGQFKRFVAEIGIDAATEGRGSVVFQINGDGKELWKSSVVSGLDRAQSVDVDVTKVDRLQLIVTDGGDGNKLDAANWCGAALRR